MRRKLFPFLTLTRILEQHSIPSTRVAVTKIRNHRTSILLII